MTPLFKSLNPYAWKWCMLMKRYCSGSVTATGVATHFCAHTLFQISYNESAFTLKTSVLLENSLSIILQKNKKLQKSLRYHTNYFLCDFHATGTSPFYIKPLQLIPPQQCNNVERQDIHFCVSPRSCANGGNSKKSTAKNHHSIGARLRLYTKKSWFDEHRLHFWCGVKSRFLENTTHKIQKLSWWVWWLSAFLGELNGDTQRWQRLKATGALIISKTIARLEKTSLFNQKCEYVSCQNSAID